MVQSRDNGITILLGLKGYEVEEVTEEKVGIIVVVKAARAAKGNCPGCSSTMLYRHGSAKKGRVLHSWSNGKKVCIDMKEALRKAAEALFPRAKVVADPFQVIAHSNKRMDEARRKEQDCIGGGGETLP